MKFLEYINKSILVLIIFLFSIISFVKAEETETLEVIKTLQKDLKTLERAVYSQSSDIITSSKTCLLYTSPSPRDISGSRMPSSA